MSDNNSESANTRKKVFLFFDWKIIMFRKDEVLSTKSFKCILTNVFGPMNDPTRHNNILRSVYSFIFLFHTSSS